MTVWLIDPKKSTVAYGLVAALGVTMLAGAGGILTQGMSALEWVAAGLLSLLGALVMVVSRVMRMPKGGVAWDPGGQVLRVFGFGKGDEFALPRRELAGVVVDVREERWGASDESVLVGTLAITTTTGVRIALIEQLYSEELDQRAEWLRDATGLPLVPRLQPTADAPSESPRPAPAEFPRATTTKGAWTLTIGFRYPLSLPFLLLSLFSLASGGLLYAGVAETGVAGFLFGPIFVGMGLVFGAIWLVRGLGSERIHLQAGQYSPVASLNREVRFGPVSWGKRELDLSNGSVTTYLRSGGARGFQLDIVAGTTLLTVGTGAGRRCRTTPEDLLEVGGACSTL